MNDISEKVRSLLLDNGASLVGFGDLTILSEEQRKGYDYGIIFAIALPPNIVKTMYPGPSMDYYKSYKEINKKLNYLGEMTFDFLKENGYSSLAMTQQNVKINQEIKCSELPHKTIATRSGLGWIGDCALLVTEKYGTAVRLSTVLTNAELTCGKPIEESRCGDCVECQEICPAQTIKGNLWDMSVYRDDLMEFAKCRDKIIERGKPWGLSDGMCGLCIYACPYTKKYINS